MELTRTDNGEYRVEHESGIAITFPKGHFNDQQRVEAKAGAFMGMSALDIARIMREIGDWMACQHYDEAMNEE